MIIPITFAGLLGLSSSLSVKGPLPKSTFPKFDTTTAPTSDYLDNNNVMETYFKNNG
jgi:hypothetical protein